MRKKLPRRQERSKGERLSKLRESSPPVYRNVDTYLAGVMHEGRSATISQLSLRELVVLRREPDNPSDPNAIMVLTRSGQPLGHIRRELASCLSPKMRDDTPP